MSRYIDADSLLTKIKAYRPYQYLGEDALSYAIKMVELEPSADVVPMDFHDRCMEIEIQKRMNMVEVVRCKDCKYWVKDGNESFGYAMFCEHDCSLGGQGIKKPDDFCSYGERKEK